jgi:hypothetical protein
MRKSIVPILLLAGLAGCAATPQPGSYGSFVAGSMPAYEKAVVDDAVKRLVAAYPPARTKLQLQHPAGDPFGTALLASMRTKGYALGEYQAAAKAPAAGEGHTFAYIFDQPGGTGLYRVTLLIDNQPLSRVYETKDGALAPAGYWVRKE